MLNLVKSTKTPYLFLFAIGLVLRATPEVLVSWYPIGYETITHYAPQMMTFPEQTLVDVFSDTFRAGPLFYAIMWFAHVASQAHPYLILKITGPILYGCLAASFFLFLKRGLNFDLKLAFAATLICVFSPVALRLSWDRFRNVLGLAFLFVTLTMLKSSHRFKWPIIALLAVITALTRDIIAIVMFATVIGHAFLRIKDRVTSLLALAPAFVIFTSMSLVYAISEGSFLWSYLPDNQFGWGSYPELLGTVLLLFSVCYFPLLPLVIKGFWRNYLLDPMLAWLIIGSFSLIIIPWMAVPGFNRWQMMFVFPFSIYAVEGLRRLHLFSKDRRNALIAILMLFVTVGVGYSTGTFSYMYVHYIPVSLVQSSVDFSQVDDVINCTEWLNGNVTSNSCILTEERFYGWTVIYLPRANEDVTIIAYAANSSYEPALGKALEHGFSHIYLTWYTDSSFEGFRRVHTENDISIFQYG